MPEGLPGGGKHWTELGRVKNSHWFSRLPALEQQSVLAALEVETFDSARGFAGRLALIYSVTLYGAAFLIWGFVFGFPALAVAGVVLGAALGSRSAGAIARESSPRDMKAKQGSVGRTFLIPVVMIIVGLGWLACKALLPH